METRAMRLLSSVCMAPLIAVMVLAVVSAQEARPQPNAAEIERMRAAMPAALTAVPAAPRRVLILNAIRGFYHTSIPYAAKAFEVMGEQTGAFSVVVTEDLRALAPLRLASFDALIMNNTTLRLPLLAAEMARATEAEKPALEAEEMAIRQGLLDFVRQGKGLVGVHAATDCLYDWPEYGEMIGGYFISHPWSEVVAVKIDDPGHPLTRAFRGSGFRVNDEIYQFREPYSREALRVLLSLDTAGTAMDKGDRIRRRDGDFAVAWIREYGRGRVFYFSLGHRHEIFWNRPILQCYLDGIQYALGDLKADATPSARLTPEALAKSRRQGRRAGLEATLAALARYRLGDDDSDVRRLGAWGVEAMAPGQEEARADLEQRLAAFAGQPEVTADGIAIACRQLSLIGSAAAVPALSGLLTRPDTTAMACYALERIPGPAADAALIVALGRLDGPARLGVMNSLGMRRAATAIPALSERLGAADSAQAQAAAAALGRIGNRPAAAALLGALERTAPPPALLVALLDAAERFAAAEGPAAAADRAAALEVYEKVRVAAPPGVVQAAAFAGAMRLRGVAVLPDLLAALRERPDLAAAAAGVLEGLQGDGVSGAAAAALGDLPALSQALLVDALASRGDRVAAPAVMALVEAGPAAVQERAVAALGRLGDASAALLLARAAATAGAKSPLQRLARASLDGLVDERLDGLLEAALPTADPALRSELIRALGARRATPAVAALLGCARDPERAVANAAVEALDQLAVAEHLPALVDLLIDSAAGASRGKVVALLVGVARRAPDVDAGQRAVLSGLAREGLADDARGALLEVLGRLGQPGGLAALEGALDHPGAEVRRVAIKALADWPDAAPLPRLRQVSREADLEAHRVLALRGYARLLAMPSPRPIGETLALYREALDLARGDAERRSLLDGLGAVIHPEALALAKGYLDHETLQSEALLAAVRITKGLEGASLRLTASHQAARQGPENAIDGTRATRWTSGRFQAGDEWFEIDLGYDTDVREVVLDAGETGDDAPVQYRLYVARDHGQWGQPVLEGRATGKVMTLTPPPTRGRYLRIEQLGKGSHYWSIAELRVNGQPEVLDETRQALDRSRWAVTASAGAADAAKAIDGDITTRWGTGRGQKPGDWFAIDLGETRTLRRVILDAARSTADYPRGCQVMVSDDGQTWRGPIGISEGETATRTVMPLLPTPARHVKIVQTGDGDHYWWSIYEMAILAE